MQLPVADWRRVTAKWSQDKNHEVMNWYFLHVGFPQLVHCSSQVSSSFRLACECCQLSSVHYFVITSRRLASRLELPQPKTERNVGQGKKERTSDTIIWFEQIKCLTGFTQLDWLAFSFVFVICFFSWTSGATVHKWNIHKKYFFRILCSQQEKGGSERLLLSPRCSDSFSSCQNDKMNFKAKNMWA